jgi:hypothetical protein
MKRITLILGVVAVMVAMLAALSAPAMAKDNSGPNNGGGDNHSNNGGTNNHNGGNKGGGKDNGGINRLDNQLDRLDNRFDVDDGAFLVTDFDRSPVFTANEGLADELCSPLSSDALNNAIPGCIFGDRNDDLNTGFVSDINRVSDIDDVDFVNVDVDRDLRSPADNNNDGSARHNDNGHHNGGGGNKGDGK